MGGSKAEKRGSFAKLDIRTKGCRWERDTSCPRICRLNCGAPGTPRSEVFAADDTDFHRRKSLHFMLNGHRVNNPMSVLRVRVHTFEDTSLPAFLPLCLFPSSRAFATAFRVITRRGPCTRRRSETKEREKMEE